MIHPISGALTQPRGIVDTSGGRVITAPDVNSGDQTAAAFKSMAQAAMHVQNNVDEAKVLAKDNQATEEFNILLTNYEALNGQQAIDARDAFKKDVEDVKASLSQDLDNNVQKKMLERTLSRRVSLATGRIDKHYSQQSEVFKAGQLKARVDNDINEAVANLQTYGKPNGLYNLSVEKINRSLDELSDMAGISPEDREKIKRDVYTGLHNLSVKKLVSEDKSKEASEYLKANKKDINQNVYLSLTELVKTSELKASTFDLSNKISGKTIGIGKQIDDLNELRKSGKIDDDLFFSVRTNLVAQHNFNKARRTEWKNSVVSAGQQWLDQNRGVPISQMPTDLAKNLQDTGKYTDMVRYSNNGRFVTEDKGFFVKLTSSDVLENMTEQQYFDNYRTKLNNQDYNYGNQLRLEINSEENRTQFHSTNDIIKNTAKTLGIIPWTGTINEQESINMYEFETRIQAKINNFEQDELQGKRKASNNEVKKIVSEALVEKAEVGGFFGLFQTEVPIIGIPGDELDEATITLESGEKISVGELGSVKVEILKFGGDPEDAKTISEVHGIMTGRRKGILPDLDDETLFPEETEAEPAINKDYKIEEFAIPGVGGTSVSTLFEEEKTQSEIKDTKESPPPAADVSKKSITDAINRIKKSASTSDKGGFTKARERALKSIFNDLKLDPDLAGLITPEIIEKVSKDVIENNKDINAISIKLRILRGSYNN